MMTEQQVSAESLRENIIVGKKYKIATKGKKKMLIDVDSVLDDRMIGDTRLIMISASKFFPADFTDLNAR